MASATSEKPASKHKLFLYVVVVIAATAGLLFGYDTGVISGALLLLKKEWSLSSEWQEILVSSVLIGAMIGAAVSGRVCDKLGRRTVIIGTAIIFTVGSVGAWAAPSLGWLIGARIVVGIAIGIASFAAPLYISEVSPSKARGALVSLNQLAIDIGILASYFIDDAFATTHGGWRYMFLIGVIPAAILGIGMVFMPRTPRWLVNSNREGDARKVLQRIGKEDVDEEIEGIKKTTKEESKGSWAELKSPKFRTALIIGVGIMFFQQVTGVNTVVYYAPTIFQFAGYESAAAAISATISVGVAFVLSTVLAIILVDRVGRRPLLFGGLIAMIVALVGAR